MLQGNHLAKNAHASFYTEENVYIYSGHMVVVDLTPEPIPGKTGYEAEMHPGNRFKCSEGFHRS